MKKEDIPILSQLVKTLREAESKLEDAYDKKDSDDFNSTKKFMLGIQKQISGVLK